MRVTRDVPPEAVADLLTAAPRGCLAVVRDGRTRLVPVTATSTAALGDGDLTLAVAVPDGAMVGAADGVADGVVAAADLDGADVQVVLDDGVAWWELRAVAVRGRLVRTGPRTFRLPARRTVCWDYGALRPEGEPVAPHRVPGPDWADALASDALDARPEDPHDARDGTRDADGAARGAADFVRRSRVLLLGTTSAGGMPFVTPIWFVPGHGRRLLVSSGGVSWAGRNVATRPQVSVLLGGERGRADRRRLLLEGTAVIRPGLPRGASLAALVARYYLAPRCAAAELTHARQWPLRLAYYRQSPGPPGHLDVTVSSAGFLPG